MRRLLQRLTLYAFHILIARPVLKGIVGVRYRRRGLVPRGPCLVVSNHNSHLDAAVLMTMFPLRRIAHVHPVAAADYFGASWFKALWALIFMNGIPIERRAAGGKDPLTPMIECLRGGESLIFFPEGSRGEAGVVARFRPGVGKLVQELPGLLVVPVFLSGPERIWPRGEVVPVPLAIDANIGRPRCYPVDEDPRVIADRVREDVLALAPPLPPQPGQSGMPPVRVAICGVDAESRSEVFRQVTGRLGALGRTVGVGEALLEADSAGVREISGPIPGGPGRIWELLTSLVPLGPRFGAARLGSLLERARISEVLSHAGDARFVVEDGSLLVDLAAAAEVDLAAEDLDERGRYQILQHLTGDKRLPAGRGWGLWRRARGAWLVGVLRPARPAVPDVLVHLTLPIPLLMERLRSRGAPQEVFESEAALERLQAAYRRTAIVLGKRRKVRTLELDLSGVDLAEATERVATVCGGLAGESHPALTDGLPHPT